jgi:HSP20 family molecular chaperone IbpA
MGQEKRKRRDKNNPELKPESQPEGMVEGTLNGLGKIIPSFGDLVKGLEKSEAFQERLEAADAEIERRMEKAPPLMRAGGIRRSIIPARTTLKVSPTRLGEETPAPASQRDVIIDTFDEGACFVVIAELPGVGEKDIKVEAKGDRLMLFARSLRRQYKKAVDLPCTVKGKPGLTYRNGILRISLEKESE